MSYKSLAIIVPAYNEEKTVAEILNRLLKLRLPVKKEIIVVDDGSSDNSRKILQGFKAKQDKSLKILFHKKNRGKGWAIRTALRYVSADTVVIQDADLEYNPKDLVKMFELMRRHKLEVLYGSRHKNKKKKVHAEFFFYWGGLIINWITNFLYGTMLTDEATCYKMFTADLLKSYKLQCQRFEFCPEVTAKTARHGIKIEEIPISYFPRFIPQGKKIRLKDGLQALWVLFQWRFKRWR